MTSPVPHGAFYVVHYTVAQKVALWYGDPNFGNALACGTFACPAADADALDTWLSGADGLEAVRVAWGVVRDFATEALAKYEDFANPPNHPYLPLVPADAPHDVAADPRPGDVVTDPYDEPGETPCVTVRFATADRVYVHVAYESNPMADFDAEIHRGADGLYFRRAEWGRVVAYVRT